ncbi:MAG: hypothetical protein VX733_13880 [Candidatus Latescibacterota bacterium]|nr:hypothetical protein [Candidatus Latescibacterota bacterium]
MPYTDSFEIIRWTQPLLKLQHIHIILPTIKGTEDTIVEPQARGFEVDRSNDSAQDVKAARE